MLECFGHLFIFYGKREIVCQFFNVRACNISERCTVHFHIISARGIFYKFEFLFARAVGIFKLDCKACPAAVRLKGYLVELDSEQIIIIGNEYLGINRAAVDFYNKIGLAVLFLKIGNVDLRFNTVAVKGQLLYLREALNKGMGTCKIYLAVLRKGQLLRRNLEDYIGVGIGDNGKIAEVLCRRLINNSLVGIFEGNRQFGVL